MCCPVGTGGTIRGLINSSTINQKVIGFSALNNNLKLDIDRHTDNKKWELINKYTFGDDFCKNILNFSDQQLNDISFNMLSEMGFTDEQIEIANTYICGAMTLEGSPELKEKHLPVFD